MSRFSELRVRRYQARDTRKQVFWGLALIGVGVAFLGDHLGYFNLDIQSFWQFWPAIIALSGLYDIAMAHRAHQVIKGVFTIAVAFWLYVCFQELWGWNFGNSWPFILIAYGASVLVRGMFNLREDRHEEGAQ